MVIEPSASFGQLILIYSGGFGVGALGRRDVHVVVQLYQEPDRLMTLKLVQL